MTDYQNPTPTVDIIIEIDERIVWIYRENSPCGWAFPGGFVDVGETFEEAAIREAEEETGLKVELQDLLYAYSHPSRDERQHNVTVVFTACASGEPRAGDDAIKARLFDLHTPPTPLVFDHQEILQDYLMFRNTGQRPTPGTYRKRHE